MENRIAAILNPQKDFKTLCRLAAMLDPETLAKGIKEPEYGFAHAERKGFILRSLLINERECEPRYIDRVGLCRSLSVDHRGYTYHEIDFALSRLEVTDQLIEIRGGEYGSVTLKKGKQLDEFFDMVIKPFATLLAVTGRSTSFSHGPS